MMAAILFTALVVGLGGMVAFFGTAWIRARRQMGGAIDDVTGGPPLI